MFKKKFKFNKFLVVTIIIFIFVLMYVLYTKTNDYLKIEKFTHEIGAYFERILISDKISINDSVVDGINLELEDEVNTLKKMLDLDQTNYNFIHANVIKRDIDWYETLTVNKGEKDGIKLNMAVISDNALIGRVIKTTASSSVIKLLCSSYDSMKVAVNIKTNGNEYFGIIDDYLDNDGLLQVNNIIKNANIAVGDSVYTNGLGGIYPSGIYVGTVIDISEDSLGLNKILKIKTDFSYDNIRFVSIVDRGM